MFPCETCTSGKPRGPVNACILHGLQIEHLIVPTKCLNFKTTKKQHNKLLPRFDLLTWKECVLRTAIYEGKVFLNPGQAVESGWLNFGLVSLLRSKQGFLCIVQPHNNFLVTLGISSPQYCYLVHLCYDLKSLHRRQILRNLNDMHQNQQKQKRR